jgi:hypothetical protein
MNDFRYYRPDNFPPIVKNLMIINALVFLAQVSLSQFNITEWIQLYPVMPEQLRQILAQSPNIPYYPEGFRFQPYQIATHMFSHGSFMHILFNMFGLWMFGKILENAWGPKRFLLFYLDLRSRCSALPPGDPVFPVRTIITSGSGRQLNRQIHWCDSTGRRCLWRDYGYFCCVWVPVSQYRTFFNVHTHPYKSQMGGVGLYCIRPVQRRYRPGR